MAAGGSSGQQQQRKQPEQELPVFCVSAKDCQRLEGRTSKDGPPSAFTKLEYTEMPQLRDHVHHVTGTNPKCLCMQHTTFQGSITLCRVPLQLAQCM